jgi:DNA-dependent protein kinase catalytic subunit
VTSLEPAVLPFASLRKPIRLGMVGEDGRTYSFIVKAGEDLRQDQRVEQLFQICNDSLATTGTAGITTYGVWPLSGRLGLIQFLPRTLPLKEVLGTVEGAAEAMARATKAYGDGLLRLTGEKVPVEAAKAVWRVEGTKVGANYEAAVERVDGGLLRSALLRLSSSPEGFFVLRRNFVQSYAVVGAMQWLLGIGDRHLSNYMLDLTTGRLVTIDFGYSFGAATSFLPVPELVPLRLTPQLLGAMAPLGTAGPFREVLARVLARLRTRPEVLLAALETFVLEPTLDWAGLARKGRGEELESFARGRVDMAGEKLAGGHPSSITARCVLRVCVDVSHPAGSCGRGWARRGGPGRARGPCGAQWRPWRARGSPPCGPRGGS